MEVLSSLREVRLGDPPVFRVLSLPLPFFSSVTLGLWVGVGSRDEPPGLSGATHLIEHLVFKGTERYPEAREIACLMDLLGGQVNAFTGKEATCFYARVLGEKRREALELLFDLVFHPLLRAEDLERERSVVLEEIRMYEDSPEEMVHDAFARALWGDHPLGREVQGRREEVEEMGEEAVREHFRRFYRPENMLLVAVGNFDPRELEEEVAGLIPGNGAGSGEEPRREPPAARVGREVRQKDLEQVHLCLGWPGVPLGHEDIYRLHLLGGVLGGGTSSRLFQELREKRGLCYSVYAFHQAFGDAGLFGVYLASSPEKAPQALELVREELERLRREGVGEEELSRHRDQVKARLLLGMESPSGLMNHLGRDALLLGRVRGVEEIARGLEAVSPAGLGELAEEVFSRQPSLGVVGPPGAVAGF